MAESKKKPISSLTLDELNAESDRLDKMKDEILEAKKLITAERAKRADYDARVVRFAKLKPEDLDLVDIDAKMRRDVDTYREEMKSRPPAQSALPQPIRAASPAKK